MKSRVREIIKFFEREPNEGEKEKGEGNEEESVTKIEPPKALKDTDCRVDKKEMTSSKKERERKEFKTHG